LIKQHYISDLKICSEFTIFPPQYPEQLKTALELHWEKNDDFNSGCKVGAQRHLFLILASIAGVVITFALAF